jgi:hypothetical protein
MPRLTTRQFNLRAEIRNGPVANGLVDQVHADLNIGLVIPRRAHTMGQFGRERLELTNEFGVLFSSGDAGEELCLLEELRERSRSDLRGKRFGGVVCSFDEELSLKRITDRHFERERETERRRQRVSSINRERDVTGKAGPASLRAGIPWRRGSYEPIRVIS